ncbi:hypothetical protein O0I10_006643 [Lichtheimia ornata]|uniref:Uncharacterized protein n=1 Tax=Lichtheimia ornata TaxID=688661 RepID=A0AAD7V1G7_9FUNG|nr:uncharacterized protein O0I10_006643 [Lichtheimia ornata]KAJ8657579.1 hypothetical protein O0I10_006643 [Lichtheimia ornata]
MTHSIWDLCKPHEHVAPTEENEDHEEVVYDATTFVHESLESVVSILNRGVLTLSSGVNLVAALRDADMVQGYRSCLAPTFVYVATMYSQQGKQRHVIDICDQGLQVVDTQDTHYAMLQRLRQDAVQRENIRIDPIKQLPFDLLSTSLIRILMEDDEPLDSVEPCPYLYVSKVWRECIIQCLGGLRFRTGHQQMENLEEPSQISIFARYTKSLCISYHSKGSWLCDLLRRNDFCMLQELIIEKHCVMFVDDFFLSLTSVGGTLTHLRRDDIYERSNRSPSPFARVLLNCPNLVSLEIFQRNDNYLTQLPKMTWPKVTTLAIVNAVDVFGFDEIKAMCERFPSLKQLTIDSCPDLQSTSIIHQYYPSMRSLHVTGKFPHVVLRYSDQGPECDQPGITDLAICMDKWNRLLPTPKLSLLFKRHHQTLESIKMEIHTAIDDASIYNIQYPRLKKLHLDKSGWWIPRNAPMLEDLCIASTTFSTHPVVLDTIPPKLKQLKLEFGGDGSHFGDKSPIEGYLDRYVNHPHLRELAIHTNNMNTMNNVLHSICHLSQLQSLSFAYHEWDANEMESFFHQLVHACPDLAKLLFTCIKAPSMAAMLALKQLANLQHIGILMETLDEDHGFWEALNALTPLKHVAINGSKAVNMNEIRRLKERRPDLTTTLS